MIDVHKLRRDYMAVSAWMVDCGEWTAAEADEVGQAIKAAKDGNDSGYLAWWAEWMARWAEVVAAFAAYDAAIHQRALTEASKARGLVVEGA